MRLARLYSTRRAGGTNSVVNPFSGTLVSEHRFLTSCEALQALDALSQRQSDLAAHTINERVQRIRQGVDCFKDHAPAIARDVSASVGKPIAQADAEVGVGVKKVQQLCDLAAEALAPHRLPGKRGITYEVHRVPKGIIDIIAPWNYPVFTALNGVIPALLAGNGVSLKHQSVPDVGAWFERAFGERGAARAPLIHLSIDVPSSEWLAEHASCIAHRIFTGSVGGGRAVSAALGRRAQNRDLVAPFASASLELGGCDAAYVHADLASPEAVQTLRSAAKFIVQVGRLSNSGQARSAVKRVLVHAEAYDAFCEHAAAETGKHVMGDPSLRETTLGPMYGGEAACDSLWEVVLDAHRLGSRVFVAGDDCSRLSVPELRDRCVFRQEEGYFSRPTLLLDAKRPMRCLVEETFGPILPVQVVDVGKLGPADGGVGPRMEVWGPRMEVWGPRMEVWSLSIALGMA